jgi:hypothetical protein
MNEPGRSDDICAISVPTEDADMIEWKQNHPQHGYYSANDKYEIVEINGWSTYVLGKEVSGPFKTATDAQRAAEQHEAKQYRDNPK